MANSSIRAKVCAEVSSKGVFIHPLCSSSPLVTSWFFIIGPPDSERTGGNGALEVSGQWTFNKDFKKPISSHL